MNEDKSILELINELGELLGKPTIEWPKPITTQVMKMSSPEKKDKTLLSELDAELVIGSVRVPCTVRVYGEWVPAEYESLSGRGTVEQYSGGIENMRVTINGQTVELGEEAEEDIQHYLR